MKISVVIPVFNELESLPSLVEELKINLNNFKKWEVIFVDDGSSDKSNNWLFKLSNENAQYKIATT